MRENIVYINDINFKNGIINIDSKIPLSMVAFESKDKYIIKDNIENSNINITKLLEKNYRYIKSGLYKLKIMDNENFKDVIINSVNVSGKEYICKNYCYQYLNNTYILEGDVYLTKNLFIENLKHSTYFAVKKEMYENEWVLKYDNKKRLEEIYIGYEKGAYVMSGISYWNIDDTKVIKDKLNKLIKNKNFKNLYWDDIVRKEVENFNINVEEVDFNCVYEIDTVEDLENVPY